MKKLFCIILAIILAGSMSACEDSIELNGTHFPRFEENFINPLPEECYDLTNCHNMYIEKTEALFGDPNYVISFILRFENLSELETHLQRINITLAEERQLHDKTYYVFQGSQEELDEYTNTKIYDGWYFIYEIIAVDPERLEVEYLYAYFWDYWKKDDLLISKLEEVFKAAVVTDHNSQ